MIGLDTNILLRWLIDESIWPDDAPHQTQLVADLVATGGERFFVNAVVLAETTWVLGQSMGQPRQVVADVVNRLLEASNVEIDQRVAVTAAVKSFAEGPAEFADHLLGQINRVAGCRTTVTFDRKASKSDLFSKLDPAGN